MDAGRLHVLRGSLLGKAIGYTLDNLKKLTVYLQDHRNPIGNHAVERAIRPDAIGRQHGSSQAANAAAKPPRSNSHSAPSRGQRPYQLTPASPAEAIPHAIGTGGRIRRKVGAGWQKKVLRETQAFIAQGSVCDEASGTSSIRARLRRVQRAPIRICLRLFSRGRRLSRPSHVSEDAG